MNQHGDRYEGLIQNMALQIIHQIKRMPSKGRYTAGKQVSRWEADSENIDIEYKNLEGQRTSACSSCTCPLGDKKPIVIKVLTVCVVFSVGLVVGFLVRKSVYKGKGSDTDTYSRTSEGTFEQQMYSIKQDYDSEFSQLVQADLEDVFNYEDHMKVITKCVHMSGVGSANKLLDYVESKWRTFPFDSVKVKKYNVTLSYANYTNMDANIVTIQAPNGTLIFRSQYNTSSSHPEYLPFSAYSPPGTVTTPNLVYAHYGRREDLDQLERMNVSVNGSILVVRYGKIHAASKVRNAEVSGAAAVILYSDPADYANNQSSVYPDTWWMPGWAVQLAHVRYDLAGDPLTPDYSSITGVNHTPGKTTAFPKIPVQPIRYDDARVILRDLKGPIVRSDWFGGLNITYRAGPGCLDRRLFTIQVQNVLQQRNISNIIAVIKGHYESDKYVIIGAHIDSWIQGGVDSGTGYTVLQELARTFAYHIGKGWLPRRTIMFALWDASKYGHIGSYEWAQEYQQQLLAGAVAYINLDALIRGNYSFSTAASSLLQSLIMDATQGVLVNCTVGTGCANQSSVYEGWVKSFPDQDNKQKPRFEQSGDDSDHGPFAYRLGVPVLFPRFSYNTEEYSSLPTYPAIGAVEDTKEYVEKFVDRGYSLHITMAKVLADVLLRLSDSAILPYDVKGLVNLVQRGREVLQGYAPLLDTAQVELGILMRSIDRFCHTAGRFALHLKHLNRTGMSEFHLYMLNNKLIQLSRAFVSEVGIPEQPQYRFLLLAPHPEDLAKDVLFPGITRPLLHSNTTQTWLYINEQVSLLVLSFKRAIDILEDGLVT